MKRIISLFIILATLLLLMSSCSLLPEELGICRVNFYVDGELYETSKVTYGQTVSMPQIPSKTNMLFVTWCTDETLAYRYDFSNKVTSDINLYAGFTINSISMTNMITEQTLKSIVTIENKCYNTVGGSLVETNSEIFQGSGVVIDISGGYCYVLTNNHVVKKEEGFTNQYFTVEDAWGNKYDAQIYKGLNKKDYAMSDSYDLALICFKYTKTGQSNLDEIAFGNDPKVNDYIATLGTPEGLQNAITYGRVLQYYQMTSSDTLNIEFEVIIHDAPITHGSSGGALINTAGQLVGINFGGFNEGVYGGSIPISKVIEFLNIYVY